MLRQRIGLGLRDGVGLAHLVEPDGDRCRVDGEVCQPLAVLGIPDADLARPVGGDDLRLIVAEYGLERDIAEGFELALLVAVGVPDADHPVAAGGDEPAVLGEPDRLDTAAVGAQST